MIGGCTNYLSTMPEIVVYMNCDTRLAINLQMFELSDKDEFIFAIKNYSYIDSGYVYLFRARKCDIDVNGEVIFKITPEISKRIKPGAFYNFAILTNAFDPKTPTEYKKLTENGDIRIEYGAQDLFVELSDYEKPTEDSPETNKGYTIDIDSARLEPLPDDKEEDIEITNIFTSGKVVNVRFEEV